MSILIKMEMPSECKYCHLYELCNLNGAAFSYCKCLDGIKAIPVEGKRPDCPLIELPPHGRLIDRDSVLGILSDKNAAWDGYVKVKALPIVIESEG